MIAWLVGGLIVLLNLVVMARLERKVRRSLVYTSNLPEADNCPPISVIKPVYGVDDFTTQNFLSWIEQDCARQIQLVFSFQNLANGAIPIARQLSDQADIEIVVNPVKSGYSGKMSNLFHGLEIAKHEFLVFSDSDIHARPNLMQQLVALKQQGFDLISCLMRHVHAENIWGRIYAAFWNFEHMAFIAPAILERGRDATGGTMAMTRDNLEKIGGLSAFKDYVAEDVAMGRKAHEMGLKVGLGPIVDSPIGSMSLTSLLNKFARATLFGVSMNDFRETLLYVVIFSYLIVLPIGIILGDSILFGAALLLASLRLGFATRFWRYTIGEQRVFVEIFLSDIIFIFAYLRALLTKRLEWGGIQYRVLPGGKMVRFEQEKIDMLL